MTNVSRSNFQGHPFHLVSPSPWPLAISLNLLCLTTSGVLFAHRFPGAGIWLLTSFILLLCTMAFWFRDIISEGTYIGNHTSAVQRGINMGVALFIISEALFFVSIFWAFFHGALSPTPELGGEWPPAGIVAIDAFELPLLNTVLLLASGVTLTYCHHTTIGNIRNVALISGALTILLALIFTALQAIEYSTASFTLSDGVFGSSFYFGTGFHGIHVIVGTIFLLVGLWRLFAYHLTENHHLGFEAGILYWHFVDIVWLVLFLSIYYWGS